MKTIEQIVRHTSQCEFTEDDWQKVLDYCRTNFTGGKIHKALKPSYKSDYCQFIDWIDNGLGAGDIVLYGHTVGIVSVSVPTTMILAAYCDYDGKLIVKDLEVFQGKACHASPVQKSDFRKLLFDNGYDFSVKNGKLFELYSPKKYSYVTFVIEGSSSVNIGMYLDSDSCQYHFAALLMNGEIYVDHKIDKRCTPLKPSTLKEVQTLHSKAAKNGWVLNSKTNAFVQKSKRNYKGRYWYITDRFTVTADKDSGNGVHDERYEVGNYFIDQTEAVLFAKEIIEKRKEG